MISRNTFFEITFFIRKKELKEHCESVNWEKNSSYSNDK